MKWIIEFEGVVESQIHVYNAPIKRKLANIRMVAPWIQMHSNNMHKHVISALRTI